MADGTILERLQDAFSGLTPTERQLAVHLERSWPMAGLGSITALGKAAGVSSPSVLRLLAKLGFRGYPEFQAALRAELEQQLVSPLAKHERWSQAAPEGHILNRFAAAVAGNLQATLARLDPAAFDAAAALLADPGRRIFAAGGRITHSAADYLVTHLSLIRPGVALIADPAGGWPPALLDLRPGDVLVAFDIRRYESAMLALVELAAGEGAEVVLVTDQWISPASAHARHRFAAHVEAPSAWDSTSVVLVLVETLLAAVQAQTVDQTRARMARLEALYAKSRLFRRR